MSLPTFDNSETRMTKYVTLSLVLLAACAAPAVQTTNEPAGISVSTDRLAAHVRTVSSDAFLGRGPATRGEELATNYIRDQLRTAGLQPGGANGSWFQDVPLLQSNIVGMPTLTVSVGGRDIAMTQGQQIAVRSSMQKVSAVNIRSAPLVFLGYGVRAPERKWDDFKGENLKGKIGIVLVNDPDFETGQGDFGGKAMTYYGRWTYKYEEAARQGLAGLLIVHETEPASYGWPTVKNSNTNTMFDIVRPNPSEVHPLLEGWIQHDDAVRLLSAVGLDYNALKRTAQTREFKPVPLAGASFSANYQVKQQTILSKNVLGRLPGTTHAGETILYGAHWDHLGVGAPDARGDTIYNGAVDNGTGIAAVLELARMFAAGPHRQRSVVFAFWTAEEKGLLGSEYYASNPVYPLETTVAGFNIDALTPAGRAHDVKVVGSGQSDLEDRLKTFLVSTNRVITPDDRPEAGYFFRSDHFPMAKRGVPMLYMDSGGDLLTGGKPAGKASNDAYDRDAYHQAADEFNAATWNFAGIAEDVVVLYRLGLSVANSRQWPNYRSTSEFRPVRDKSEASRK
ncbi:MAG: M28 family metallopeptidase [Gemmatimonadaceae bacterium]